MPYRIFRIIAAILLGAVIIALSLQAFGRGPTGDGRGGWPFDSTGSTLREADPQAKEGNKEAMNAGDGSWTEPTEHSEHLGSPDSPDYGPLKGQLIDYIAATGATYGIYFKDLRSGAIMEINGSEPITAASTVKVPVVLYLSELIAQGKLDWDDRITYYKESDYQDGAGILQFTARDGDRYSLRVLANLAITISDNVANRMLMRHLGKENIKQYMEGIGGKTVFPDGANITTAEDMGAYMQAVLDLNERHPELGARLLDDMSHPIYHVGLPGKLPENLTIAHKEGDVWGVANDAGIVFAPRPYILVVLSKGIYDLDRGFENIAQISRIVYDYQMGISR